MTNFYPLLVLLLSYSGIAMTSIESVGTNVAEVNSIEHFTESPMNYITTAVLEDGESEIRMRFGDTIVREASVGKKDETGVRNGLLLRQIASGPHLLQLIYKVEKGRGSKREVMRLLECEMIDDWGSSDQFRNHFREDLIREGVTLQVPPNHFDFLKTDNNTRNAGGDFSLEEMELAESDIFELDQGVEQFKNVSVRALRNDEIIGELQQSFDMIAQQRKCKRLHRKMKKAAKSNLVNEASSDSINEIEGTELKNSKRVRREAFRVGIMPGTLWCGDGSLADKYEEMGAHVGTDRCCREHDGCPFIIHGMTSKYGMFNYRMHTVSHCTCDERFRSCLKQTNTGSSNFVGKLFFNVVQTKCFVLKPEKLCTRRSWFGKCLKFEFKKQAHLREPTPY